MVVLFHIFFIFWLTILFFSISIWIGIYCTVIFFSFYSWFFTTSLNLLNIAWLELFVNFQHLVQHLGYLTKRYSKCHSSHRARDDCFQSSKDSYDFCVLHFCIDSPKNLFILNYLLLYLINYKASVFVGVPFLIFFLTHLCTQKYYLAPGSTNYLKLLLAFSLWEIKKMNGSIYFGMLYFLH